LSPCWYQGQLPARPELLPGAGYTLPAPAQPCQRGHVSLSFLRSPGSPPRDLRGSTASSTLARTPLPTAPRVGSQGQPSTGQASASAISKQLHTGWRLECAAVGGAQARASESQGSPEKGSGQCVEGGRTPGKGWRFRQGFKATCCSEPWGLPVPPSGPNSIPVGTQLRSPGVSLPPGVLGLPRNAATGPCHAWPTCTPSPSWPQPRWA
jgi:hypothetical protein